MIIRIITYLSFGLLFVFSKGRKGRVPFANIALCFHSNKKRATFLWNFNEKTGYLWEIVIFQMEAKAKKLINMVLEHEGGYSSGADTYSSGDAGLETYRGISRKYNPSWDGWVIVDKNKPLKYNQKINDEKLENSVQEFYFQNYYTPMKIDKLTHLLTAGHVFCHGVNAGIKTSVKLLQKAINKVCGVNISVDGIIGSQTLNYANGDNKAEISNELINQRNAYYTNLAASKPSQQKFLNGWLNRVKKTTTVCSA